MQTALRGYGLLVRSLSALMPLPLPLGSVITQGPAIWPCLPCAAQAIWHRCAGVLPLTRGLKVCSVVVVLVCGLAGVALLPSHLSELCPSPQNPCLPYYHARTARMILKSLLRFYDKAHKIDALDFFKKFAVSPDELPDTVSCVLHCPWAFEDVANLHVCRSWPLVSLTKEQGRKGVIKVVCEEPAPAPRPPPCSCSDLTCVQVFASIGRTVFRDIGPTALGFRLVMKVGGSPAHAQEHHHHPITIISPPFPVQVMDYGFFAWLTSRTAGTMPDFKRQRTEADALLARQTSADKNTSK